MKVKIKMNGKEDYIDAEKITIRGITLSAFIKRFVRLEKSFNKFKKKHREKDIYIKKSWKKMRKSD